MQWKLNVILWKKTMHWKLKYVEIDILQLFLSGHSLHRREVGQRVLEPKVSGAALVGQGTLLHYETGISAILRQRPPSGARRACRHCNNSVALWPWLLSSQSSIDTFWFVSEEERVSTMSEAEEYEVETIVSKRLRKGKLILWVATATISWGFSQERRSTLWSGRDGRTLMTTPGSRLATLSAMWVLFISIDFTTICKHWIFWVGADRGVRRRWDRGSGSGPRQQARPHREQELLLLMQEERTGQVRKKYAF